MPSIARMRMRVRKQAANLNYVEYAKRVSLASFREKSWNLGLASWPFTFVSFGLLRLPNIFALEDSRPRALPLGLANGLVASSSCPTSAARSEAAPSGVGDCACAHEKPVPRDIIICKGGGVVLSLMREGKTGKAHLTLYDGRPTFFLQCQKA